MTILWNKVASVVLAGVLVAGTSVTSLAAENPESSPAVPAKVERSKKELTPEQKSLQEHLLKLRRELKQLHEKIGTERQELGAKLKTIREVIKDLRNDPDKNKQAIEKAREDFKELLGIREDLKRINTEIKSKVEAMKAALGARDGEKAAETARELLSLLNTKLDLLKRANHEATQVIAHLKGAAANNQE